MSDERTIDVTCHPCPLCGESAMVSMPLAAYKAWQDGLAIQKAWPGSYKGERELLISGYHDACFNQCFPPEPEP